MRVSETICEIFVIFVILAMWSSGQFLVIWSNNPEIQLSYMSLIQLCSYISVLHWYSQLCSAIEN